MTSSPSFDPTCPSGGSWYACGDGAQFVGCCTSDPCNNAGCSIGDLEPAAFSSSAYATFPDALCPPGASFYTCVDPSFLGCCASNPCTDTGCPASDLVAAYLPSDPSEASYYNPQPPLSSSATASSSSAVSATFASGSNPISTRTSSSAPTSSSMPLVSTESSMATASSTNAADSTTTSYYSLPTDTDSDDLEAPSGGPNIGAIAGGVAGGGAALLLILGILLRRWRRHLKASRVSASRANNWHVIRLENSQGAKDEQQDGTTSTGTSSDTKAVTDNDNALPTQSDKNMLPEFPALVPNRSPASQTPPHHAATSTVFEAPTTSPTSSTSTTIPPRNNRLVPLPIPIRNSTLAPSNYSTQASSVLTPWSARPPSPAQISDRSWLNAELARASYNTASELEGSGTIDGKGKPTN